MLPVLIAGAGPVGLALAADPGSRGLRCMRFDGCQFTLVRVGDNPPSGGACEDALASGASGRHGARRVTSEEPWIRP